MIFFFFLDSKAHFVVPCRMTKIDVLDHSFRHVLQNHPPKRSRMPNPLPVQNQRNRQRHNRYENPSHRAKRANIARLHPPIDAMKETESYDVLRDDSQQSPYGYFLFGFSVTYLKPVNKQQRVRVDRQIAIADISHRGDRHECEAYSDHAVAEEPTSSH